MPRIFDPDSPEAGGAPLTVGDVVSLYLRHCAGEGTHCQEARAERERVMGLFVLDHGGLAVADCRHFHLADWIEGHADWRSVSTRRAKANMIRAAFQWAVNGERINKNPFARVRYAEAERRPELADDTFDRVSQLANKPFEKAVRFLRLTGCRLSELAKAEWPDMDFDRGVWTIHKHKSRKRTGKAKIVALVPAAIGLLKLIRGEQEADYAGVVFLNNRGTAWNRITLGQHLRRMKIRHGIKTKATLHGIRHRMASESIASGAPLKMVSAQLGHASSAITERYYCHIGEGQIEAIRAAAQLGQAKKPT